MKIQLIKLEDQPDQVLFKSLYATAQETKIGIFKDGKILFKIEEYLYLMNHLAQPKDVPEQEAMAWQLEFQNRSAFVAANYNAVYFYP